MNTFIVMLAKIKKKVYFGHNDRAYAYLFYVHSHRTNLSFYISISNQVLKKVGFNQIVVHKAKLKKRQLISVYV
jgi:hypothetical protein